MLGVKDDELTVNTNLSLFIARDLKSALDLFIMFLV